MCQSIASSGSFLRIEPYSNYHPRPQTLRHKCRLFGIETIQIGLGVLIFSILPDSLQKLDLAPFYRRLFEYSFHFGRMKLSLWYWQLETWNIKLRYYLWVYFILFKSSFYIPLRFKFHCMSTYFFERRITYWNAFIYYLSINRLLFLFPSSFLYYFLFLIQSFLHFRSFIKRFIFSEFYLQLF